MLNMLSQIGSTAEFYTDRLRQRIQTFATMISVFKFWLGRLFVGTESGSHLEQNSAEVSVFKNISLRACLRSKINHTLLFLNQNTLFQPAATCYTSWHEVVIHELKRVEKWRVSEL